MPLPIKAVIVDDEALARDAIRLRLKGEPDIEVVGEAADGADAVDLLRKIHPDLLFLDVQMPVMDGFEVIEHVPSEDLPIVVFVTAYDRYALKAFETHALDYLLKPFTASRFHVELLEERRRARVRPADRDGTGQGYLTRLAVKRNQRIALVGAADIDWIESSGNYAHLHAHGASYVVRMTMGELERRLDPARFARIHRSTIVQIDRIQDIIAAWHGDFDVTLRDGTVLRLSRNYRDRVLNKRSGRL